MTYVHQNDCESLRVILCLQFDPRAKPAQVTALKNAIIDSENVLHSVEVAGDFDFMTEIAPTDLGSFNRWWKGLADTVAPVVTRCEKSFVCRRFIRRPKDEHALWVRAGEEIKRLPHEMIDKIVAERDYARVFSNGQSWLLHATMHSLFESLRDKEFIQLHRSIIVRHGFIDRLSRVDDHWEARLRDGTSERVAKSHVADALKMTHSSTAEAQSSNGSPLVAPIPVR
jgi:hypothetical protein